MSIAFSQIKSCEVVALRNAFGVISKVAMFFTNCPKRQAAFAKKINHSEQPNRKKHLLDLCRTRWMERHEALENFCQFYEIIVPLMKEIKMSTSGWNSDTVADACSLLSTITNMQFVMAFVVAWKGLSLVKGLSIGLQSSCADIIKAHRHIDVTK